MARRTVSALNAVRDLTPHAAACFLAGCVVGPQPPPRVECFDWRDCAPGELCLRAGSLTTAVCSRRCDFSAPSYHCDDGSLCIRLGVCWWWGSVPRGGACTREEDCAPALTCLRDPYDTPYGEPGTCEPACDDDHRP